MRVSEQEPNLFEFLQRAEAGSTKSKEKEEGKKIFRFAQDDTHIFILSIAKNLNRSIIDTSLRSV